ncbi:glycosyltransferase family 39 protein [bacterium]|nr:glycosyltransferase family 39 protein [bacterium]
MLKQIRSVPPWIYIFALAYLLRFIYVMEISDRPYFTAPAVDAEYHDDWAQRIAGGEIFDDEPFFRAPLYPYFLGAVYAIFGHDYFIVRIIQIFIGSLSCVLIYYLGGQLFSQKIGILSGLTAACAGIMIYFDAELLLPVIELPLYILLFISMLKASEHDRWYWWFYTGLTLGLAAVTRPNILAVFPILLFIIFKGAGWKRGVIRLLITFSVFLIPLAPVIYHNISAGEFVPIATQGGVNFYIGNNQESKGHESVFPGLGNAWEYDEAMEIARSETGKNLTQNQISNYYYRKGMRFILEQPLDWLMLTAKKAIMFFGRIEISNNKNIYFFLPDSVILTILMNIGFWFIGPLGILGMILYYKRSPDVKYLSWIVILYSLSIIIFFVTSRYRLPLLPVFIIFCWVAVDYIVNKIRMKDYHSLQRTAVIILPVFLLVNINFFGVRKISEPHGLLSLGSAYLKNKMYHEAEEQFNILFSKYPAYPQGHLNLGVSFYERAMYDRAEAEFLKEIQIDRGRDAALAYNNLGNIRVMAGKPEEAVYFYHKALQKYPNFTNCKMNLADVYAEIALTKIAEDSLQRAAYYFEETLKIKSDNPSIRYNYGLVLGELGDEAGALNQMREALKIDPNFEPALNVLQKYSDLKAVDGER